MTKELSVKQLIVGQLQTNCYLIMDNNTNKAVIVDPGDDTEYINNMIRDLNIRPTQIIATHGHFDHIMVAFELQQAYKIPFLIHGQDAFLVERMQETAKYFLGTNIPDLPPKIDGYLNEQSGVKLGKTNIKIIDTPGHTPGSVCLYFELGNFMLTGDTIFADGGVGRTDFKYASSTDLAHSIDKIFEFPENTLLYPGHGGETTIARERKIHSSFRNSLS